MVPAATTEKATNGSQAPLKPDAAVTGAGVALRQRAAGVEATMEERRELAAAIGFFVALIATYLAVV